MTTTPTTSKKAADDELAAELELMSAEQLDQPGSIPWRAVLAMAAAGGLHQLNDANRSGVGVLARRGYVSKAASRFAVTETGLEFATRIGMK